MKNREKNILRVEEALIRFHRRPISHQTGPFWEARLMARLREERVDEGAAVNNGSRISRTVWRFAAVTCLIAVVLAVYVSGLNLETQYQVAELILDDASGMDLALLFASL